jgi:hypothetical protein
MRRRVGKQTSRYTHTVHVIKIVVHPGIMERDAAGHMIRLRKRNKSNETEGLNEEICKARSKQTAVKQQNRRRGGGWLGR